MNSCSAALNFQMDQIAHCNTSLGVMLICPSLGRALHRSYCFLKAITLRILKVDDNHKKDDHIAINSHKSEQCHINVVKLIQSGQEDLVLYLLEPAGFEFDFAASKKEVELEAGKVQR